MINWEWLQNRRGERGKYEPNPCLKKQTTDSMKQMLVLSMGFHCFFLLMFFSFTFSVGWKASYLQAYQVDLVELPERNMAPYPRPLVKAFQPKKAVVVSKKARPEKVKAQKIHLPKKEVIQEKIVKPTVVQKRSSAPGPVPSKRQKRVQELKKRLAEMTQQESQEAPPLREAAIAPSSVTPMLEVSNFPFPAYLLNAEKKLRRSWAPPPFGSVNKIPQAVVVFRIARNGKISGVKVEKGSGNQHFDLAALRAVYEADPLPPLPREYSEHTLLIHVSFLLNRSL